MHHDYVFIASHLGADVKSITEAMDNHPEISVSNTSMVYATPPDLAAMRHVCEQKKEARIYVDSILFNHALRCTSLYDTCKFIYFLDCPIPSVNSIIKEFNYQPQSALNHYAFRLQRLSSMVIKTPNAMLITNNDLTEDGQIRLAEFLKLKQSIMLTRSRSPYTPDNEVDEVAVGIYNRYIEPIKKYFADHLQDQPSSSHSLEQSLTTQPVDY